MPTHSLGRRLGCAAATVFAGIMAAGCSPAESLWSIDAPKTPGQYFALDLAQATIGYEQVQRDPHTLAVTRNWRFSTNDAVIHDSIEVRARLDEDGRATHIQRWDTRGLRSWHPTTVTWLPEAPPSGAGPIPIFDSRTGTVELQVVDDSAQGRRIGERIWTSDGGWSIGALRARPVNAPPALPAPDLLGLIRVPSPIISQARQLHRATWQLGPSTYPVIVPLGAELPAAERARIQHLVTQVRDSLHATPTPGRLSAAAALAAGTGDCTEHVALFIERADAAGIEVRSAEGLVYVDQPEPGFVPHAWADVRIAGRWVPVDPTWGQVPADATHIVLSEHERLTLITHAGRRTITLVEAR